MRFLLTLLLIAGSVSAAEIEVSVVTDWETVTAYGSVEETERAISSLFEYADTLYQEQLNINISVTNLEIPTAETDDTIPNHTHAVFLIDSLLTYRANNVKHYSADVMVLVTKRDLKIGTQDLAGYANIRSICATKAIAIVELVDNGLDGDTLAHELGHVLGAPHDGDSPCEKEPSRGYLMSSATHTGINSFSQCSIHTINLNTTKQSIGSCLFETNLVEDGHSLSTQPRRSGGGSAGLLLLLMLLAPFVYHYKTQQMVIK